MAEALQKAEVLRKQLSSNIDEPVKSRHSGLSGIGSFCNALKKNDSRQAGMTVLRRFRTFYEGVNIAHELRTPLAIMKAQSEAMIDGLVEDKQAGLRNIKDEIEKLIRLVEGIEDLTKAEASFFIGNEYLALNLKEFLRGLEYSMEPMFHKKKLSFSLADRGDLKVLADADKLERIISNLLSNSLKYTDRGGVWLDYGADESEYFIEVRDTGRGIPENEIPKIFTRFYRGRETTDAGVGIGLAIVKELVDAMKGRIEVKSRFGEGTTFKLWLPTGFEG